MKRLERIASVISSINKMEFIGDWNPKSKNKHGYLKQDIGILTNPKGVEKILKKWNATDHAFYFYFLKGTGISKHAELGEMNSEWIKEKLKVDIQPTPNVITVIFTNNTGDEKVPLTAWIMAHRIGHALRLQPAYQDFTRNKIGPDFRRILNEGYDIQRPKRPGYGYASDDKQVQRDFSRYENIQLKLAHAVGTMKSAREGNLRNFDELAHELFAQYIFSGKVKFNPLPEKLSFGRNSISMQDPIAAGQAQDYLEYMENTYPSYFEKILSEVVGKIFVM